MEKRNNKAIPRTLTAALLTLVICFSTVITAFASDVLGIDESGTYELFNSGSTASRIPDTFMNPSADTLTNGGNDIIARMDTWGDKAYDGCVRETRLGQSFTVDGTVINDANVFINAYDVDSINGEYDIIYLVNETTGKSEKIGVLSGRDRKWRETAITIDKELFIDGNTYHFELYVADSGYFFCYYERATWQVAVRSVNMTVVMEKAPEVTYGVIYDANGAVGSVPDDANAYAVNSVVGVEFAPIPALDGSRFLGWSFDKDSAVADFTADGTISFTITENTTLYAVWTDIPPVVYDAIFVVDGAEYRRVFEENSVPSFDGSVSIDKNDGRTYTFTGWDAYRYNDEGMLELFGSYDATEELPEMTEDTKFIAMYAITGNVLESFGLSVTMKVGEIIRFNVNDVEEGNTCLWLSADTGIADVNPDGCVTAVAAGDTIVTVIIKTADNKVVKLGYIDVCVIPQEGHIHEYTATVVEPTCTEQGYTEYLCGCGDSYRTDYVPALWHDYVKGETFEATCDSAGYTLYICKNCGTEIRRDYVPRLGHCDGDGNKCCDNCGVDMSKVCLNFCKIFRDFFESILNFVLSAFSGLGDVC